MHEGGTRHFGGRETVGGSACSPRGEGGADIISFNLYVLSCVRPMLRPCEMSSEKVIDFVIGFRPAVRSEDKFVWGGTNHDPESY